MIKVKVNFSSPFLWYCISLQVSPKSIAYRSGLRVGDGIIRIGNTPAQYLNHQDAKMEIIRAGNELDFVVQRYGEIAYFLVINYG